MEGLLASVERKLSLSITMNSASSVTWMLAVRTAPVSRLISPKNFPGPSVATIAVSPGDFSTITFTLPLLMI